MTRVTRRLALVAALSLLAGWLAAGEVADEPPPPKGPAAESLPPPSIDEILKGAEKALAEVAPLLAAMITAPERPLKEGAELYVFKMTSAPDGADVEIDGIFEGNCTLETRLEAGVHAVKVSLPGYEVWEKKVRVRGDARRPYVARLRPRPATIEVNVRE